MPFYAEKVKLNATRQINESEEQQNPYQSHLSHNPDTLNKLKAGAQV